MGVINCTSSGKQRKKIIYRERGEVVWLRTIFLLVKVVPKGVSKVVINKRTSDLAVRKICLQKDFNDIIV